MFTKPLQISSSKMDSPSLVVLLAAFPSVSRHGEILSASLRIHDRYAVSANEPLLECLNA